MSRAACLLLLCGACALGGPVSEPSASHLGLSDSSLPDLYPLPYKNAMDSQATGGQLRDLQTLPRARRDLAHTKSSSNDGYRFFQIQKPKDDFNSNKGPRAQSPDGRRLYLIQAPCVRVGDSPCARDYSYQFDLLAPPPPKRRENR